MMLCILITIDPNVSFNQSKYTVHEAVGLVVVVLKCNPPPKNDLEIEISVKSQTASGELLFKTT